MPRVLFCAPTYFDVVDVKNPFMDPGKPVNKRCALQQWDCVRKAFEAAGCELERIKAVRDLEDMVFAANLAVAGRDGKGKPFIVPSRMKFESRQREVPHYV